MPAGLVDAGESAAESAVRELKEETGYVGVAAEISPIMFNGTYAHHLTGLVSAHMESCSDMGRSGLL